MAGRGVFFYYKGIECSLDLEAVQDSATHVSILPKATMLLEKYEAAQALPVGVRQCPLVST